jgi:hypothetical protein
MGVGRGNAAAAGGGVALQSPSQPVKPWGKHDANKDAGDREQARVETTTGSARPLAIRPLEIPGKLSSVFIAYNSRLASFLGYRRRLQLKCRGRLENLMSPARGGANRSISQVRAPVSPLAAVRGRSPLGSNP